MKVVEIKPEKHYRLKLLALRKGLKLWELLDTIIAQYLDSNSSRKEGRGK